MRKDHKLKVREITEMADISAGRVFTIFDEELSKKWSFQMCASFAHNGTDGTTNRRFKEPFVPVFLTLVCDCGGNMEHGSPISLQRTKSQNMAAHEGKKVFRQSNALCHTSLKTMARLDELGLSLLP